MTPERLVELKEHLEDSELTIEESVECLDEIERLTAENLKLKDLNLTDTQEQLNLRKQLIDANFKLSNLQAEKAELRKATGEAFENGKRVMLSFIQENGLVEAWRICDELKPEAKS